LAQRGIVVATSRRTDQAAGPARCPCRRGPDAPHGRQVAARAV